MLVDAFVVMPNHVHAIIILMGDGRGDPADRPYLRSQSLGAIVGQYKSIVTKRVAQMPDSPERLWQRNYHDHIIRNEANLNRLREYITNNPARWQEDSLFSE